MTLEHVCKDVFERHIFSHLSCSDCMNLVQTCKTMFKFKPIISTKFLNRISELFVDKYINHQIKWFSLKLWDPDDLLELDLNAGTLIDPTQTDPTQTDLTRTDPTQTDPTQSDPTQSDPTKTDPTQSDPTQSDPTQSDPTKTILNILHKLTSIGVLSGGSVVYGLNDFVTSQSVSDYDIYLSSPELFNEALSMLTATGRVQSVMILAPSSYGGVDDLDGILDQLSILDVNLAFPFSDLSSFGLDPETYIKDPPNLNLKIQLIYYSFAHPSDVVKHFDLDYVQCAFYQGQIFRTMSCSESHSARKIIRGYHYPRDARLRKALHKGFSGPLLGSEVETRSFSISKAPVQISLDKEFNLVPFKPKIGKEFVFERVQIVKLMIHATHLKRGEWYDVQIHSRLYHDGQPCHVTSTTFLEVDFISYDEETKFYKIEPLRVNFCTITRIRGYKMGTDLGKKCVQVQFRYHHKSDEYPSMIFINLVGGAKEGVFPVKLNESILLDKMSQDEYDSNCNRGGGCG